MRSSLKYGAPGTPMCVATVTASTESLTIFARGRRPHTRESSTDANTEQGHLLEDRGLRPCPQVMASVVLPVAGVVIVGVVVVIAWLLTGDPISQAKWDELQEAMTKDQVLRVLGEPDSQYGDDQFSIMQYSRFPNLGYVEFRFDESDVLVGKNDEFAFGSLR